MDRFACLAKLRYASDENQEETPLDQLSTLLVGKCCHNLPFPRNLSLPHERLRRWLCFRITLLDIALAND